MRANPFQEKSLLKSNTYLLNYGEDNLTMYRSLTKKETSSNGRGNVIAETNILNRVRKEAYEARKYKQNEDSSLYLDNSRLQQQR